MFGFDAPSRAGSAIARISTEKRIRRPGENFDIAQNVFLGRVPVRFGRVDRRRMARETTAVLEELDVNLPSVRTPVRCCANAATCSATP